jgi:predicted DNA-binding transcriptional regulator AlpA
MEKTTLGDHSPAAGGRFFGIPDEMLFGTWSLEDIAGFLGLSERKVGDLMRAPGAPAPLRLGSARCKRWSRHQVVAWWHGCPDAADTATGRRLAAVPDGPAGAAPDAPADGSPAPVPGRPWRPRGAR